MIRIDPWQIRSMALRKSHTGNAVHARKCTHGNAAVARALPKVVSPIGALTTRRTMITRSKVMNKTIRSAQIMALSLLISVPALATEQITVPPCNMDSTSAGYKSGTYQSDAQLFAAPPAGVTRTGMFVQCLTASCLFALNMSGGTASLSAAGNIVVNGQYGFFNAASFGFVPQGAVRIIASGSSVITAVACPQ